MEIPADPKHITPDCLCVHRKQPYVEAPSYPLWRKGEDNAATLSKHGYFVVRGLLTNEEVEETKEEITKVVSGWYEKQNQKKREGDDDGLDWEEIANRYTCTATQCAQSLTGRCIKYYYLSYRLPEIKEGSKDAPSDPELAIRRLFRMSVHNQYFRDLSQRPKIVSMISELIGSNVKLLQSMSLLKPPGGYTKP